MSNSLVFHRRARNGAASAFEWYRAGDPGVAAKFDGDLTRVLERIEQRPLSFPAHRLGTRRALLSTFPYLVIFREMEDCWVVLAVAHRSRRPGYWRGREQP